MTLLLLACATPPADTGAKTPTDERPTFTAGYFLVEAAEEWEGDCEFSDDATYLPAEEEWIVDPRGDVLILTRGFWYVNACSLEGDTFLCDNGSWEGGRMQVTRTIEGRWESDDAVEGAFVVELDCGGAGCDTLQDTYGDRLDFPCRAEAPFSGVRH